MNDEQILDAFTDLLCEVEPDDSEIDNLLSEFDIDPAVVKQEAEALMADLQWRDTRMAWIKRRLVWYIKQLFPLRYESQYIEDSKPCLTIWRMWLGRCFNVRSFILASGD